MAMLSKEGFNAPVVLVYMTHTTQGHKMFTCTPSSSGSHMGRITRTTSLARSTVQRSNPLGLFAKLLLVQLYTFSKLAIHKRPPPCCHNCHSTFNKDLSREDYRGTVVKTV